jgi:chemotaxis signal transduction protein
MSRAADAALAGLAELRRAFDESFAAPLRFRPPAGVSLLAIRAAGEALALRASRIGEIVARRSILPVPSRVPEMLGVLAVRGALAPVYDLAALLGLPSHEQERRWIALASHGTPVGLAFDELEGQIEVAAASLCPEQAAAARPLLPEVVRIGSGARAVVDLPALLETIERRAGLAGPAKE